LVHLVTLSQQDALLVNLTFSDHLLISPIKSETEAASKAGKVILKLGIFEKIPQPEWESFVKDRHDWVPKHEGIVQYKIATGGEKVEE